MSTIQLVILCLYLLLIFRNYTKYIEGKKVTLSLLFAIVCSVVLLFSSKVADLELDDTGLDISGYRTLYEKPESIEPMDLKMYYIFYGAMRIGETLGLSYRNWWAVMSILSMVVILLACKIHRYNVSIFLATFMIYYEFVFYSGLKFYYGFCLLLLAYGFLLRNNFMGRILFALFTFMAAGFHVMYYLFLALLLKPIKYPRFFVTLIAISSILLTAFARINRENLEILTALIFAFDNDHLNVYTEAVVNNGFYIALFIHLIVFFTVLVCRRFVAANDKKMKEVSDTVLYTVMISFLFFPFYALSLTFMRLITAFSLVVLASNSIYTNAAVKSRWVCLGTTLLVVLSFHLIQYITSIGAETGFYKASVQPFFDIL